MYIHVLRARAIPTDIRLLVLVRICGFDVLEPMLIFWKFLFENEGDCAV